MVGTVPGHPISSWPLGFVVLIPSLSVNTDWLQAGRQAGRKAGCISSSPNLKTHQIKLIA